MDWRPSLCSCWEGLGALAKPKKRGNVKIGYWRIRGLGAPLRMMLEYAGSDYEDKQYMDINEWFYKDKPELSRKNALANLPYLVDGDIVICQTNAIFEYLGDRYGLSGQTMEQKQLNMQMLCEIYDLRNIIMELAYPFSDACRNDDEFVKKMMAHCQHGHRRYYEKLEAFFGLSNGPFSCGGTACAADFHVFEMLDQHELFARSCKVKSPLENYKMLKRFHLMFRQLPELQNYFVSSAYKLPCHGSNAYTSRLLNV